MDHPLDTFGGIAILVARQQPLPVGMAATHSVLGMQAQSSPPSRMMLSVTGCCFFGRGVASGYFTQISLQDQS